MRSLLLVTIVLLLLSSCSDNVAYHHYEKIADEGWDVRDTVTLRIDTIREAGSYTSSVCVRTTPIYPYRNISLMVYQTIYHRKKGAEYSGDAKRIPAAVAGKGKADTLKYTKGRTIVYTMPLEIKQEDGIATGQGVTYYAYERPYATTSLAKGDSLAVVIRHHMRREVLPGITDIGIKLTKN